MSQQGTPTVSAVVSGYAVLTQSDARSRWRWARQLMQLRDTPPTKKAKADLDKELGEKCATAVGRATPYSAMWVRNHVMAAQLFETEPTTPQDCQTFLDRCNGNQSRTAKPKQPATKEDAIKAMVAFARSALKRGATADEVTGAIEAMLDAPSDERKAA